MSLKDDLINNSTIKYTAGINDSKVLNDRETFMTSVPIINIALGGTISSGLQSGSMVIAGESRSFKTLFSIMMIKSYLDKYKDSVCLFYDSEFGSPGSYFDSLQVDSERIVHSPLTNIEEMKFDVVKQLGMIKRKDKVIIVIDSIGNLPSKKEVDDATDGKSVTDMTRAKALKSFFRIVTPHLTIKDVPLVSINHVYKTQEMYSKNVISGGTGVMLGADHAWIITKRQDKDGTELKGYHFVINIEKSRFVKEKSKFPVTVGFDTGIEQWSGLLEIAVEGGYVTKPSRGWYAITDIETGEVEDKKYREKDTYTKDFWKQVFNNSDFGEYIRKSFELASADMNMMEHESIGDLM